MNRYVDFRQKSTRIFWVVMIIAALFLLAYVYIYTFEPFSSFGNDLASNLMTIFAALCGAAAVTGVWVVYDRADPSRQVWSRFALGLWLWTFAELAWSVLNMTVGEVEIGFPDIFWILAYGPLAAALFRQYRLVVPPLPEAVIRLKRLSRIWYLALLALSALVVLDFFRPLDFITILINAFYPLGDLLLGLGALWLVNRFRGGTFARPWNGFLWFTVSDLLFAVLEATGAYTWSVENSNFLSTFADVLYTAAYLAVAIGALGQWLTLRYAFTKENSS